MRGLAAGIVVYQQGAQALQFRDRLKSEARLFGEDGVRLKFGDREPIVRASTILGRSMAPRNNSLLNQSYLLGLR